MAAEVKVAKEEVSLTAEAILSFEDLKPVPYNIPEWGGKVFIRQLSAAEGLELGELLGEKQTKGSNVKVLVFCLSDAAGKRLFRDDQTKVLQGKSMKVLNRAAQECLKVNGIGADSAEQKAIDADAKNV
jgi:hypothetical protein